MKKTTVFLFPFLFLSVLVYSQKPKPAPTQGATFCGKTGEDKSSQSIYSITELQDCDFIIVPADPTLTVVQFKLSLVAKDKSYSYKEKNIIGNTIPEEYRSVILSHTKNIFLEYIIAANSSGVRTSIKPIAVRIQ